MADSDTHVIPHFLPGDTATCRADGAVVGMRLVKVTADREDDLVVVGTCGAGEHPYGVASRSKADGTDVGVFRPGCILPVIAGAAITVGQAVKSDALGELVPADPGELAAGIALSDADDDDEVVLDFRPHVVALAAGGQATALADLVDNSGAAAADGTIAAIPAIVAAAGEVTAADLTTTQATTTALANAIKELATKQNATLARLRTAGVIAT